MLFPLVMSVRL